MSRVFLSPEPSTYKGNQRLPQDTFFGEFSTSTLSYSEHLYCCAMAEKVKSLLEYNGFEVFIANADDILMERVLWANTNDINYYMAIHTNAGGGTGAEMLSYDLNSGSAFSSYSANKYVYDELTQLYPSTRGIKDYSHFIENNSTKMVSCYPEIAFHDNPADLEFLLNKQAEIAEAITKGICKYFNVEYKAKPVEENPSTGADYDKLLEMYNRAVADRKLAEQTLLEHITELNTITAQRNELQQIINSIHNLTKGVTEL